MPLTHGKPGAGVIFGQPFGPFSLGRALELWKKKSSRPHTQVCCDSYRVSPSFSFMKVQSVPPPSSHFLPCYYFCAGHIVPFSYNIVSCLFKHFQEEQLHGSVYSFLLVAASQALNSMYLVLNGVTRYHRINHRWLIFFHWKRICCGENMPGVPIILEQTALGGLPSQPFAP